MANAEVHPSVLGYVAFTVTICYHTEYAYPWIYGPLAFYALYMLMRLLKYRIKDATLVPVDQNMTLVCHHLLLPPAIDLKMLPDSCPRLHQGLATRTTRPPPRLLLRPHL